MIRERRITTIAPTAGGVNSVELPKDAVYHQLQLEIDGQVSIVYPANGGGSNTNTQFAEGFPFNVLSKIRLVRNGSDAVWSGSGKQMARESLYLNGYYPFARIWVDSASANGTANALLTKSVNGVTVPSNSEGIGSNQAVFNDTEAQSSTNLIDFRCVLEMWLQLGVDDSYFTTLVDARPLASYVLELTWDSIANIIKAGSAMGAAATVTYASLNCAIMSYDQDNLDPGIPFGTFKRASFTPPGMAYSSTNVQALLPRGNLYYGILMETLGLKSAGLSTIAQPGNDIVTEIQNRINSNYLLRDVFFRDLQAKNRNDGRIESDPYNTLGAAPLGWALLFYPCTGASVKELVATYTMDQFDLLLATNGTTGGGDGNTYNGTPTVNLLTQEVIPGKSVSPGAARGAFAGSMAATTAKPGG